MRFPSDLRPGTLIQRYKRFLADVAFDDGTATTVHVPNPGAMLGLNRPGLRVWASDSGSTTRKLPLTLEMVETTDGGLVGVNTLNPNRLVAEALAASRFDAFSDYPEIRAEAPYGTGSRIDFVLTGGSDRLWLEVKNCHFSRTPGLAEFPDCVAARSAKHLRELEAMVAAGDRAALLFVVQREDCQAFSACREIDPTFASALDQAAGHGVEVMIRACSMSTEEIVLAEPIVWRRD